MVSGLLSGQSIFKPVNPTGLPYTIIISELQLGGLIISPLSTSEIGVFDDTLCVGSAAYVNQSNLVLTAWKGDFGTQLPGFENNHLMKFKFGYFENSSPKTTDLYSTFSTGNGMFGNGSYSIVKLETNITHVEDNEGDELGISIFPNPFNGVTTVQIKSDKNNEVVFRITDTIGKTVAIRQNIKLFPGMQNFFLHEFKNFSSGTYFLHVEGRGISKLLKLVYLK